MKEIKTFVRIFTKVFYTIMATPVPISVRNTCIEMLQQRGYNRITQNENASIVASKSGETIVIFFNSTLKLDVERVKEYITLMVDSEIHHSIIIYKDSVTPVARKVIEELPKSAETNGLLIELFEEKSLRYNITKHRLVPKHTALSKSESAEFRAKFGTKIPALLKVDPVVRFYNFQRGDIVRIDRVDGYVSFRLVR